MNRAEEIEALKAAGRKFIAADAHYKTVKAADDVSSVTRREALTAVKEARAERNEQILRAYELVGVQEIADYVQVTHATVSRIVSGADRPPARRRRGQKPLDL